MSSGEMAVFLLYRYSFLSVPSQTQSLYSVNTAFECDSLFSPNYFSHLISNSLLQGKELKLDS